MLIKFRFKNFKSFHEEACLDLQAANISEYGYHVRTWGSEKVLPTATIYGANASGKSNVLEAFDYMTDYVINSFAFGDIASDKKIITRPELKYFKFASKEELASPKTEFEIWFTIPSDSKEKTYNYGFVLGNEAVEEEWLNIKAKTSKVYRRIFYRNLESIDFKRAQGNNSSKSQSVLEEALDSHTLLLSLGAKLKISPLDTVRNWFFNTTCINFGHPELNAIISRRVEPEFADDLELQQEYVNFISTFDQSITGFEIKKTEADDNYLDIKTCHLSSEGELVSIDLEDESDGTLKMFSIFPFLRNALKSGGVLLIDELNSRLHPLLVRLITQTFTNPLQNPYNAQLIFTSHDVWQLSENGLRRDEIWFTDKNDLGESELYSLFDFEDENDKKIRKDADFTKNYLLGKYGAIPSLKQMDLFSLQEDSLVTQTDRQAEE